MAQLNRKSILLLILSYLCIISISGGSSTTNSRKVQNLETRKDDSTTITNPANFPPYTPTPTIVTVPGSNPTTQTPMNPIATPTTSVPTTTYPITNPAAPVTNPTTTYPTTTPTTMPTTTPTAPTTTPGTTVPAMNPPTQTSGQSWCIAKAGAPESSLQTALDYACGNGADCSTIQQGSGCYNPDTLENHASYAFNSYYQNNPAPTSCNFGGVAVLVNTNPSSGTCVYPSSATGTGTGAGTPASTTYPPATTTSTNGASGLPNGGAAGSPYEVPSTGTNGYPPSFMNSTNPASAFPTSFGPDTPPTGSSFPAGSAVLQPCIGFMILVASFSTTKLIFGL